MGFAKRMWEDEQTRQYISSSDAICADCFDDEGLKRFVADNLEEQVCTVCGRHSEVPIAAPANAVLEFFMEKINQHYEDPNNSVPWEGGWQARTYNMYDLLYDQLNEIGPSETLDWLDSRLKGDREYVDRNWDILKPSEALEFSWKAFAESVKHVTRFLFFSKTEADGSGEPNMVPPEDMLEALGAVIRDAELVHTLPTGSKLYRARGHKEGAVHASAEALGAQPLQYAKTAGRMNAPGIVVFYVAEEMETAIAEATGGQGAFSIGTFETLREVTIVDLTRLPPVPSIFEDGPRDSLLFLRQFAREVSQPFEPDAEIHIEYVPTQVVSEFLRHRFRGKDGEPIRGVVYGSAKRPGSKNVALFIEAAEVEGVKVESWRRKDAVVRLLSSKEGSANL